MGICIVGELKSPLSHFFVCLGMLCWYFPVLTNELSNKGRILLREDIMTGLYSCVTLKPTSIIPLVNKSLPPCKSVLTLIRYLYSVNLAFKLQIDI